VVAPKQTGVLELRRTTIRHLAGLCRKKENRMGEIKRKMNSR
jgi:hypothetical protein